MRRRALRRVAEKKTPRRLEGREHAGANGSRRAPPGWFSSEEGSGSRRRRRPGGARSIPAAGVLDPYEPRRREKFIPRGQWKSNHAHAARSTRFTAVAGRAFGRTLLYFSNNTLIGNDIFNVSIFWQNRKKANCHANLRASRSFSPQIYPQKVWISSIFSPTSCDCRYPVRSHMKYGVRAMPFGDEFRSARTCAGTCRPVPWCP